MRDIERRLVSELMKNSRRSDMELAHVIGVSKPTITRTRERLEKEGVVKEYTMIPELSRLGYQIMALTLGKFKPLSAEEIEKARETLRKAFEKASFATVLLETGAGMGYDGMMLSLHENYSSYAALRDWLKQFPFLEISKLDNFLIDLNDKALYPSRTLSTLAKSMLRQEEKQISTPRENNQN